MHHERQLNEWPGDAWPGIGNDEQLLEKLEDQVDRDAPVFETTGDFLDASS